MIGKMWFSPIPWQLASNVTKKWLNSCNGANPASTGTKGTAPASGGEGYKFFYYQPQETTISPYEPELSEALKDQY